MANTVCIDVRDITVTEKNHVNIAIINKPNPVSGYDATAREIYLLMQFGNYRITKNGTNDPITGNNYYDYFPEEQPGGGGSGSHDNAPIELGQSLSLSEEPLLLYFKEVY